MKKALTILLTSSWLVLSLMLPSRAMADSAGGGPSFTIYSVVQDQTVTVKVRNFPANLNYEVLMGPVGTQGINGIKVATRNSGKGGMYLDTYTIPIALQGYYQIAIRIQRASDSGYIDDNVFYNNTRGTQETSSSCDDYEGYPTFSILNVFRDLQVTVQGYNFPPDNTFEVLMGAMGTRGVNGIQVATLEPACGEFPVFAFKIPAALHGLDRIAIRMQSLTKPEYVAFNWFYNSTGVPVGEYELQEVAPREAPQVACPGYSGYPTFSILSVVRDRDVVIRAFNLPRDQFEVRMGAMYTRGIGGVRVGEFESECDAMKDLTFEIPAALYGSHRISMRFESTTGRGYYAYNWFYNNTTP